MTHGGASEENVDGLEPYDSIRYCFITLEDHDPHQWDEHFGMITVERDCPGISPIERNQS